MSFFLPHLIGQFIFQWYKFYKVDNRGRDEKVIKFGSRVEYKGNQVLKQGVNVKETAHQIEHANELCI